MNAAAVLAIAGYQRWLSPYKGFRCAHDVLWHRGGCSGFGKRAFGRYPTLFAWDLLRRRFAECRLAALILTVDGQYGDSRGDRRRERKRSPLDACTPDPCMPFWIGGVPDCNAISCEAHHCFAADACAGLDFAACA